MDNYWPRVRTADRVSSVLMVLFGVGIIASMALGLRAKEKFADSDLWFGMHGLTILLPGIRGIFSWWKSICCNVKPTRNDYIISATFDSCCIVGLFGFIIVFSYGGFIKNMLTYKDVWCSPDEIRSCSCSQMQYSSLHSNRTGQEMASCAQVRDGVAALIAMWILGAASIITHLTLSIFMACKLKALTRALIIYATALQNLINAMNQQTFTAQSQGYSLNAQPQNVQTANDHVV